MGKSRQYNAQIEERLVDCILVKRMAPKNAVAVAVQAYPDSTGLDVVFALVSIAESARVWRPKDQFETDLQGNLYEACAILGADLFVLEKMGVSPATCRALTDYWGGEDGFFKRPK